MKKISARWRNLYTKAGFSSFMASLLAILCGLVVGFVVLLVADPANAFWGLLAILTGGLSDMKNLGQVLYAATPIILTGLSVGFANGPVQHRRVRPVHLGRIWGRSEGCEMHVHPRPAVVAGLPAGRDAGGRGVGPCSGLFEGRVQRERGDRLHYDELYRYVRRQLPHSADGVRFPEEPIASGSGKRQRAQAGHGPDLPQRSHGLQRQRGHLHCRPRGRRYLSPH